DGQTLFSQNCASCHAVNKRLTGPALAGVTQRGPWKDRTELHAWVHNPAGFMKTNTYTAGLYKEYQVMMQAFPQLSDKEIDAIIDYTKTVPEPQAAGSGAATQTAAAESNDNTLLFGVLTLILAVVSFVLLQVNSNLKRLTDQKEGLGGVEPVPFWRNKAYIAFVTILLFLFGGYLTVTGAINLGRTQGYEPEQPIFYSHKVHAGINQISCLYCHGNTEVGKQANIPSVNICMNCHMGINEYKGEKLYRPNGEEVDGTAEIKKLYKYAGYESGKIWDASKAKPIAWTRIHNLPKLAYFNHSQHVKVGKIQCQTCHGEIQKMDEVHQFADLSMGWCINCHRNTQVQFNSNGFYSIYEKFHDEIKNGTLDTSKITVEKIGGTECQKCHY
ncbi:MAG: c-type cytochrome, partial [Bacteroidota bacterium]|nr:c-type cytochrome [Bacteroidota bacterium]